MLNMEFKLSSLKDTKNLAFSLARFLDETKYDHLIYLNGELGAGKTTFSQFFFDYFGIEGVTSPSYTLINTYTKKGEMFYHADVYRVNEIENLVEEAALEEIMQSPSICLIEWTKKFPHFFNSSSHIEVEFFLKNETRHALINLPQHQKEDWQHAALSYFPQRLQKE